jgi:hypothetical protein
MNRYLCQSILGSALVITLLMVGPIRASDVETATDYTAEACIECHRMGSEESDRHINVDDYQASVHSQELTCQDCHTGVVDDTHQSEVGAGAVDCGDCHEQENRHGPVEARIQCHDCHTQHNIRSKSDPASTVHVDQLPATCGGCHPVASGESDYFSWFPSFQIASHKKGDFAQTYEKTSCLGCHQGAGAHGESEPINDQNCYKCHYSQTSAGAIWGEMHPQADRQSQPAIFAAASIYQVFIAIGLIVLLGKFLDLVFDRFSGKSK